MAAPVAAPMAAPVFEEALEKVFTNWTLLALAVDQGWGGRESRAKRQQLQLEVSERLKVGAARKRPPSWQNEDDVQELADYLYNRVLQMFSADTEDESDVEVARLCLRLHSSCSRDGDVTFAQEFMQVCRAADLAKCNGVDRVEYATEADLTPEDPSYQQDLMVHRFESMEIDGEGGSGSDDSMDDEDGPKDEVKTAMGKGRGYDNGPLPVIAETEAAAPAKPAPEEPIVDEDGFTSVAKGLMQNESSDISVEEQASACLAQLQAAVGHNPRPESDRSMIQHIDLQGTFDKEVSALRSLLQAEVLEIRCNMDKVNESLLQACQAMSTYQCSSFQRMLDLITSTNGRPNESWLHNAPAKPASEMTAGSSPERFSQDQPPQIPKNCGSTTPREKTFEIPDEVGPSEVQLAHDGQSGPVEALRGHKPNGDRGVTSGQVSFSPCTPRAPPRERA